MNDNKPMLQRRDFLRGALVGVALIPITGALASCVGGGGTGSSAAPGGTVSATNPFGMTDKSTVDAVIFKGGYGIEYAEFAAKQVEALQKGSTVKVTAQTNIAQTLQPRFVAGNPPDVIDNSGAGLIGINTIRDQLEDLTSVIEAKNYEGKVIKDTLYPGVIEPGTFDGKFVQLNYVLTVYAVWYSATLFDANGWTVPKTWDEMLALGEKAKAAGKYLFGWGKEAATYYLTMAIGSAIKQGGDEVRLALDNLKADCWSLPAMQDVLGGLKKIIDAGYMQPGGAGTQFTAAQAQWSNAEQFILYPSGGWIENEMKSQTKADFKMTGAPEPTVDSNSKFPWEALHSTAGEGYLVPSQGKNVAGGKEFMRAMLSNEAAVNFAKTTFSSTIVKDTIPADGFGSTALVSQVSMLEAAGDNIFSWNFVDLYGLNTDLLVLWNTFLQGGSDVATLTSGMQAITDKVAGDSSVKKVEVKEMTAVGTAPARPGGGGTAAARRWTRKDLTFDKISFMIVFLVVPVVGYIVFVVSPFIQAAYYSLTDWSGFTAGMNFIGVSNYVKLFQDATFLTAMRNSVTLAIVLPIVTLVVALIFASLVTIGGPSNGAVRGLRNSSLYRVVSFFPYVIPAIVIGLIWQQIYDPNTGILNGLLTGIGLDQFKAFAWLGSPNTAMIATMFVIVWGLVGFYMVLFIAAIKGVPAEIYEAARIDGAGRFRTAVTITIPLIRDNIQTAYIYMGILALDAFVYMAALNPGGGPNNTTLVMSQQLFTTAFTKGQFGYACAMGVVLALITLLFAGIVFAVNRLTGGSNDVAE